MKIKFNKYERVAGIFVAAAIVGSVAISAGVAIKKGWFASKVRYHSFLESAEGIHAGTAVQIQGLRAGSVESVELKDEGRVKIKYAVFEKFKNKIRKDSFVQVVRPFIIGEKVLDVNVGSKEEPMHQARAEIAVRKSFDIMELVSGKTMGPFLGTIEQLASNMKILAEAFSDPERTKSLVAIFDKISPLVTNLNKMSKEVVKVTRIATRKKHLDTIIENLALLTGELNKVVPPLNKEAPDLGVQMAQVVQNLNTLTLEFKKITPAIATVAPVLPQTSLRAVEALNEAVVLLKAMQKSFFLRGNVKEVLKEEAQQRAPASK